MSAEGDGFTSIDGGRAWTPISAGAKRPPTDAVLNRISQEFTYEEIADGTEQFSANRRLGAGAYGTVYRGLLQDATEVAIKTLASPKEGGFREEVEVLSRFRHPNLVILLGFARKDRERYLVYEFLSGGDVETRLNEDSDFFWKLRLSVSLDASLGLSHLHGSRPQVFHRDVKTQNILLDRNGTGKVADFGLACLAQPNEKSLLVSKTSGTLGYADPIYIHTGRITEQSEVYSMGMVLFEVLTGRPPVLQYEDGRVIYPFDDLNGDLQRLYRMLDPRGKWPAQIVERLGELSFRCISDRVEERPRFVDIVKNLRNWLRDESLHQAAAQVKSGQDPSIGASAPKHVRDGDGVRRGQTPQQEKTFNIEDVYFSAKDDVIAAHIALHVAESAGKSLGGYNAQQCVGLFPPPHPLQHQQRLPPPVAIESGTCGPRHNLEHRLICAVGTQARSKEEDGEERYENSVERRATDSWTRNQQRWSAVISGSPASVISGGSPVGSFVEEDATRSWMRNQRLWRAVIDGSPSATVADYKHPVELHC